ncbi:MAG TPA: hypothetical protein VN641_10680, partial [Urbifossiella sp.]|nr:hypothetical protein [Urbifossiella sp.]
MVFQATKWNWKRLAARALLIPVLAGSAGVALAQFRSSSPAGANKTAAGPVMTAAAPGDPKSMLKEGRKALAAGHFNDAQDYARRADDSARAKNFKWGLFDDTPNALLKDVQAAVVKTQKHEAERLVKQAKTLLAKHPANDREKAANLDAALQMARRADSLHGGGGYSVWDFGDRPDKMVKEIEAARAKMKLPPAPVQNKVVTAMGTQKPGAPSGVVPAGGLKAPVNNAPATPASNYSNFTRTQTPTANAAVDPRKVAAVKLMTEGRQLANQGDFAGAHAKYTGAQKLNARFAANEFGPDSALQDLNLHGSMAIKNLIEDAKTKMQRKDFARADAALNAAHDIALALNLFPLPIEKAKADLRTATNGKFGGVSPSGLSPAAGTERLIPLGPAPAAPVPTASAPGVANIVSPATPPKPATARVEVPALPLVSAPPVVTPPAVVTPAVATPANITPGALTSRQMLYQAAQEYTKGDFDIAAKLARQAYNLGNEQEKVQATGLLNSIDVDVAAAKKRNAAKSYEAAVAAYQRHDHGHALSVFVVIDPNLLPADQRAKRDEMIASCKAELDKSGAKVAVHAGGVPPEGTLQPVPGVIPPGTARVGDGRPSNPDSLATQADSLRKVAYQKMRSEGLKVQSDAQAAFGRGETDVAMQMLIDYSNRVRAAGLDTASVALLLRPIDSRMEMFRVMKGQKDAITRVNRENREAKELVTSRAGADEQRKAEVAKLVRQYKGLMKEFKYSEAERVAMQAVQLQPDDVALDALRTLAKTQRRLKNQNNVDLAKEGMFAEGMLAAENEGPFVDSNDPVSLDIRRMLASRGRGRGDDAYLRSRTPKEFEIELKLDRPVLIDYTGMPLSQVIEDLRDKTKVDFSWDTPSLTAEQISTAMPINEKLTQGMSLRNALHLILDKAKLSFVIEYDTVRITTQKMAKGRLVTKVFSVADLVTPVPNFALPDYANFDKMINA